MTHSPDEFACLSSGSFLPDSFIQKYWDSTSLGMFKTCPRLYYYSMIVGLESARTPTPLIFGILFHSALETYHHSKAQGKCHDESLRDALWYCLLNSGERVDGVWLPWNSDDNNRNSQTLFRTVLDYFDNYSADPAETVILADGTAAVELSFQLDIDAIAPDGENYILCGHLDRVATFLDQVWVFDAKTTTTTLSDYYFKRYTPDNQMSLYSYASRAVYNVPVAGVIVDAAQILVGGSKFQRAFAHRTPGQLEEWMDSAVYYINEAASIAERAYKWDDPIEAYPMNDSACQKYGGCAFINICSKDPQVRGSFLKQSFKRKVWDPSKPR